MDDKLMDEANRINGFVEYDEKGTGVSSNVMQSLKTFSELPDSESRRVRWEEDNAYSNAPAVGEPYVGASTVEPKTFEEAVRKVVEQIADVVISKQKDYGHQNILSWGDVGIKVRLSDKIARLNNLYRREQQARIEGTDFSAQNESVVDTFTDVAGYAIIALMLDNGTFTLDLQEDQ